MKKTGYLLLMILFTSLGTATAQQTDFSSWNTFKFETKVNKWHFSAEPELRYSFSSGNITRLAVELNTSYPVFKKVRLGISYSAIDHYDQKYADYQFRNRFSGYVSVRKKLDNLQFTLNEKIQCTVKDEADRIKTSGESDSYAINPEWTWRNKLKAEYNIPDCRITPAFSAESFFVLNDPDGNKFEALRYNLGIGYKLNRQHRLELNGILDQEMNSGNDKQTFVIGIGYTFTLK